MSEATELVTAASSPDAREGLQAARALRRLAETLEAAQVESARRQGWSWTEIAAVLEVSKQAVHQRYARRTPATDVGEA
jgi:DNA-directed RNA polymerase specialized sigma24 family protein